MGILSKLCGLFSTESKPHWKKHPDHFHGCPRCEKYSENVRWKLRTVDAVKTVGPHQLPTTYTHYVCPNCGCVVSLTEHNVNRLDKVHPSLKKS